MEGRRWRIGDGQRAMLWTDPWVSRFSNLSSYSHVSVDFIRDEKVQSLLENDFNSQNIEKVKSIFYPHIAAEILKLKLGSIPRAKK